MRFMVMVKATKDSEAGKMPSEELLSAMAKFNEEMVKAGVMLDGNGLQASSKGARVRFSGDKRTVIDGPFAETKELVAGYWILQVKSKQEAIEWIKRCPNPHESESEIEIRQLFELEDFGESDAVEHHRRLGEQIEEVTTADDTPKEFHAASRSRMTSFDVTAEPVADRAIPLALKPSGDHDHANPGNAQSHRTLRSRRSAEQGADGENGHLRRGGHQGRRHARHRWPAPQREGQACPARRAARSPSSMAPSRNPRSWLPPTPCSR